MESQHKHHIQSLVNDATNAQTNKMCAIHDKTKQCCVTDMGWLMVIPFPARTPTHHHRGRLPLVGSKMRTLG